MSLSSTDKANRYFVYDFTAIVDAEGGMSFGIPPVNENQFGTSRACLIKLSKVQLAGDTDALPIDWYRPASATTNYRPNGIFVETNISSRNYAQISNDRGDGVTSGTGANQSTLDFNAITSKVSIPIYTDTPEAIKYVSFEDQNSIFDNGLICGLPFGNIIRFSFKEGVKNQLDGGNTIYPVQAGTSVINGWMSVRLEIFILEQ
jgi:hypothetical protein